MMEHISCADTLKRALLEDITIADIKCTRKVLIQNKVTDSLYDYLDEMAG